MNLQVTQEAAKWYEEELSITPPGFIRFFPRYGGFGGHIPGFSVGINQEQPENIYAKTEVNNITFYVETKDAWYFEDLEKITIDLNKKLYEPVLIFDEKK